MRFMPLLFAFHGWLLSQYSWASGVVLKKAENGNIYTPVVEFVHPAGQKVLFIGLIHFGPKSYYEQLEQFLVDWRQKNAHRRTLTLLEGARCGENQEYLALANSTVSPATLDAISAELSAVDIQALLTMDQSVLPTSFSSLNWTHKSCTPSRYGHFFVPTPSERSIAWCQGAQARGMTCQPQGLNLPQDPEANYLPADYALDVSLPYGEQWIAGLLTSNLDIAWDWQHAAVKKIMDLMSDYSLKQRNSYLLGAMQSALDSGERHIVLPWGAMHGFEVKDFLQQRGFSKTSTADLLYMTPQHVGVWRMMDDLYNSPDLTGPEYGY